VGGNSKYDLTLALILTFSPEEKEQRLDVLGLRKDLGANPVADFFTSRRGT
jgi:hypothetical protein